MVYDLDSYREGAATAPVALANVVLDPEVAHKTDVPATANHSNDKAPTSGIRLLEILLAVVVALAVIIGLAREFGGNNTGDIPPADLEFAFNFAPDAPNPACAFQDIVPITNNNGAERLKLRAIINEEDETLTIQAEREGNGWIGISINDNLGMVPNTAVIGTPADGLAEEYFLGGKSRSAVERATAQSSISEAITLQEDERTILSFTIGLGGFDGTSNIRAGESTRIMWAIGNDGDVSFERAHAFNSRGFTTIEIGSCNLDELDDEQPQVDADEPGDDIIITPFAFAPESPYADCPFDDDNEVFVIENGAEQERLVLRAIINEAEETISIQAEREGEGWIGISINDSPGMVPNVAAIGTPADGNVEWYNLGGRSRPQVTLLNNNEQNLEFTQVMQQDGRTVISFTAPLGVEGSLPVGASGSTRVMWAIGADGDTEFSGAHAPDSRGFATIVPFSCGLAQPVATSPPTRAPTTSAPTDAPTASPVAEANDNVIEFDFATGGGEGQVKDFQDNAKVYSKVGNHRSCQADVCPGTWWDLSQNGCSCSSDGLNTCYTDQDPVTLVSYNTITYTETWSGSGTYKMSAEGGTSSTEFGVGGDYASADTCYDDWRRGGFKVDLTGSSWGFHGDSVVWTGGYSPSMKIWADDQVIELHENNQETTLSWNIPAGTRTLEVVCGGWPAECWSDLFATRSDAWN